MVKVIASNDPIRMALERALPILISAEETLVFVVLDQLSDEGVRAAKEAKERPMIFTSFLSGDQILQDSSGNAYSLLPLLQEAQCGFIQLPFELVKVVELHDNLLAGKKLENHKAIIEFTAKVKERRIGVLLHDLYPGKPEELRMRTVKQVEEEFGITGTEDEVRTKLEELREEIKSGRFVEGALVEAGEVIPGVFCDVEGTIIWDDELIPGRLEMLAEYAKTGPIALWTGGNIEELGAKLVALGVPYPLVSKYDFEGKTVAIAIDDLSEADIEKAYGIKAEQFVRLEMPE